MATKFNSENFALLIKRKVKENNLSMRSFTDTHKLPRSPLMKALRGDSKPTPETLVRWCDALKCTLQERTDIFHSVGYLSPEEAAQASVPAA